MRPSFTTGTNASAIPPAPTVSMCALSSRLAPPPVPGSTPTTLGRPGTGSTICTDSPCARSQEATKEAMLASPLPVPTRSGFTDSIATSSQTSFWRSFEIEMALDKVQTHYWIGAVQPHRFRRKPYAFISCPSSDHRRILPCCAGPVVRTAGGGQRSGLEVEGRLLHALHARHGLDVCGGAGWHCLPRLHDPAPHR